MTEQIVLGNVPDRLTLNLSPGSPFTGSIRRADNTNWPAGTAIELRIGTAVWPATITSADATWDRTATAVDAVIGERKATLWLNGTLWATGHVIRRD